MTDNKYSVDLDSLIKNEDEGKKELRRKKHKRVRIISWVIFVFIICLLTTGAGFAIHAISAAMGVGGDMMASAGSSTASTVQEPSDVEDTINDILESETSIDVSIPENIEPEPTEEELFAAAVESFVNSMSLQEKVAGVFVVSLEQLTGVSKVTKAGNTTKAAFENYAVGGIVITAQNIKNDSQLREMLNNIESFSRYPLFMSVDEEPGNTVLAGKLKLEKTLNAAAIGETMDPGVAYDESGKIVKYLTDYGFNTNLGIVGEVLPGNESVLGNRAFGQDPVIVGQLVSQTVAAYEEAGITTAVKYFPGEGGGNQSTSAGISTTERTKEEFLACELQVFKKAVEAGGDILTVSHVYAPNLTGDNLQCSRSKYIMSELIRKEMGLTDVIIMTDAMNKPAITEYFESGEAAVASIKAGADMILLPANFEEAYNEVYAAVIKGVIDEARINDALKRIYSVKLRGWSAEEVEKLTNIEK